MNCNTGSNYSFDFTKPKIFTAVWFESMINKQSVIYGGYRDFISFIGDRTAEFSSNKTVTFYLTIKLYNFSSIEWECRGIIDETKYSQIYYEMYIAMLNKGKVSSLRIEKTYLNHTTVKLKIKEVLDFFPFPIISEWNQIGITVVGIENLSWNITIYAANGTLIGHLKYLIYPSSIPSGFMIRKNDYIIVTTNFSLNTSSAEMMVYTSTFLTAICTLPLNNTISACTYPDEMKYQMGDVYRRR